MKLALLAALSVAAILPTTANANVSATCAPDASLDLILKNFVPGRYITTTVKVNNNPTQTVAFTGPTHYLNIPGANTTPWTVTFTWGPKPNETQTITGPACTPLS